MWGFSCKWKCKQNTVSLILACPQPSRGLCFSGRKWSLGKVVFCHRFHSTFTRKSQAVWIHSSHSANPFILACTTTRIMVRDWSLHSPEVNLVTRHLMGVFTVLLDTSKALHNKELSSQFEHQRSIRTLCDWEWGVRVVIDSVCPDSPG